MSRADRLIAGLAKEGQLAATGRFTLDRDKAREKMRQFQLADARRYVLLLVEAALLKGASRIDFAIDADDMRMAFDGRPFTTEDFDGLYGSWFSATSDPDERARRELAFGLNAAMALNPRWIRVDSGDGLTGARLEMKPDQPDAFGPRQPAPAGTRIHVKERFRPGLVVTFFQNIAGTLPEELFLKERCAYAQAEVVLEGKQLSHGLALPEGALGEVKVSGDDFQGAAGFCPGSGAAMVRLITHGVWIATHPLAGLPDDFLLVVEGSNLQKDVSQSDVVLDDAHQRVCLAAGKACEAALCALCAWFAQLPPDPDHDLQAWARAALKLEARKRADSFKLRGENDSDWPELTRELAEVALWESVLGEAVSLRRVIAEGRKTREVLFTPLRPQKLPTEVSGTILLLPDLRDQEFFRKLFGQKCKDAGSRIRIAVESERRRQAWLSRRARPVLGFGSCLAREPIRDSGFQGEIGLREDGTASSVTFIVCGCALCKNEVVLPGPAFDAVLAGAFTPDRQFRQVVADDALLQGLVVLLRALDSLLKHTLPTISERTDPGVGSRIFQEYLLQLLDLDHGMALLLGFGFSEKEAVRRLPSVQQFKQGALQSLGVGRYRESGAASHPLAPFPAFERIGGAGLSLDDLQKVLNRDGSISFSSFQPGPGYCGKTMVVVEPGSGTRKILEGIFGREVLRDATEEVRFAEQSSAHLAKPGERLEIEGAQLTSLKIEEADIQGIVALMEARRALDDPPVDRPPAAPVRVLRNGRFLVVMNLAVPVAGIRAVVNSDTVRPNSDWTGIEDESFSARLQATLIRASLRLLEQLCGSIDQFQGARRIRAQARLLEAAAALLPNGQPVPVLPGFLLDAPMFVSTDDQPVTLRAVAEGFARSGKVTWVDAGGWLHGKRREAPSDRPLIRLEPGQFEPLQRLFGSEALEDGATWVQSEQRQVSERSVLSCPPERSCQEALVEALRAELKAIDSLHWLRELDLDRLAWSDRYADEAVSCSVEGTVLNGRHRLVREAVKGLDRDPAALAFLASVTVTAINLWADRVTEADEGFIDRLADRMLQTSPRRPADRRPS